MSSHYHAVVWIDHHEARVVHFNADAADETVVHPAHPPRHLHGRSGSAAGTHLHGDPAYFREIADALAGAKAFLVTGPSTAKVEFATWLREQGSALSQALAGVETAGQLSDRQLVADARRFFAHDDRLKPQIA